MTRRYLITGGAGFIGSNFIRFVLANEPDVSVVNVDSLSYSGVRSTLTELQRHQGHRFVHGDIRDSSKIDEIVDGVDVIVHFAAESHVDRSIDNPRAFFETNVLGTGVLIDAAMRHNVPKFIHVSTDEVYGSLPAGFATEAGFLNPTSPYAASKAASDLLVHSYLSTYDYPVIVTRCTNNYGPYQFPEKLIPLFITNLLEGERVPLYGDGRNERDWLHVEDHCAAISVAINAGSPGVYNLGAYAQRANIDVAMELLRIFGRDESWIDWVEDRKGHDRRYAVDSSKIRALGWEPTHNFEDNLPVLVDWYRSREDWWRPLKGRQ